MTETLHPEETITSFLLVRHGHTRATEEGLLYSNPEAPLTDKGLAQARALAEWIPLQAPDMLLTSPALRVRSTADLIAAQLGVEPVVVEGLDEWRVGDWEGRTYLDLKKNEPEAYRAWSGDPIHNAPPGGESIVDLQRRVASHTTLLIAQYAGKRLVLVTHAGVIRSMLVEALGIPVANFWRVAVPVGSVSRVDFSPNFATVHYLSWRPHLFASKTHCQPTF